SIARNRTADTAVAIPQSRSRTGTLPSSTQCKQLPRTPAIRSSITARSAVATLSHRRQQQSCTTNTTQPKTLQKRTSITKSSPRTGFLAARLGRQNFQPERELARRKPAPDSHPRDAVDAEGAEWPQGTRRLDVVPGQGV